MDLVKELHIRAIERENLKKLATKAAAVYVGYHEHMCGDGYAERAYLEGFQAGYATCAARLRKLEVKIKALRNASLRLRKTKN